ncbi:hypothetical protein LINPERHAP1_LOCUS37708 [Linum perenne]
MNPDVVDIASSSFSPLEVIPTNSDEDSSGPDHININLDGPVDVEVDEEVPKGEVFGAYYPESDLYEATANLKLWKELTFGTLDVFDDFF